VLKRLLCAALAAASLVAGSVSGSRPAGANETGGPQKCVSSGNTVADAYNAAFGTPMGFWQAGDVPQWYPLPDGSTLWILNDSYLNRKKPAGSLTEDSVLVRNIAVRQFGNCFEPIAGIKPEPPPDPKAPPPPPVDPLVPPPDPIPESFFSPFEKKDDAWWWAHGGVVSGEFIHIFFTFMRQTGPAGWGINFAPRSNRIVTFRWRTMEFVSSATPPNDSATPIYGFSIASDADWTYLFGASGDLRFNFAGKDNYVARVPRGRVFDRPNYWNGSAWVSDPAAAVSISTEGSWAHRLRVMFDDDRWVAVSKEDEFFGDELLMYEAPQPQGPWRVTQRRPLAPRSTTGNGVTYEANVFPRLVNGKLIVNWSNNDFNYGPVKANPGIYRPSFAALDLGAPTQSNAICHGERPGGTAAVAGTSTSRFIAVNPTRAYDSRTTGAKVAANGVVTVDVAAALGVPKSSMIGTSLNVTIDATSGAGYATVWPAGAAQPTTSNLNADHAVDTNANFVTVPVNDGKVSVFVSTGTDLIVDVFGWYERTTAATAGRFIALSPDRAFDSRNNGAVRPANSTTTVFLAGRNGVPATGARAAVINLTATDVRATGFVTAWGNGASPPATSNLNVSLGNTRANQAIVPIGDDGAIHLFTAAPMHLIVDVVGYITDATAASSAKGLFVPVSPIRLVDSRNAPGVPGRGCVATVAGLAGTSAAVTNVTITGSNRAGFATAWPSDRPFPTVSTLNIDGEDQTRPNHAVVPLAPDGTFSVYLEPRGHLIVDLMGYFT
jgi:hypothetical protein